jgi:hypothetical protein
VDKLVWTFWGRSLCADKLRGNPRPRFKLKPSIFGQRNGKQRALANHKRDGVSKKMITSICGFYDQKNPVYSCIHSLNKNPINPRSRFSYLGLFFFWRPRKRQSCIGKTPKNGRGRLEVENNPKGNCVALQWRDSHS